MHSELSILAPLRAGIVPAIEARPSGPTVPVATARSPGQRTNGGRSTAAVLWLMILLVFLPIATAHVVARSISDAPEPVQAAAPVVPKG